MSIIRPFHAIRPAPERASLVASVPYDVVSEKEARELGHKNPWSFLHISRAEINLPEGTSPYSDAVYECAATQFKEFIKNCPLLQESKPSIYVYRLRMGFHEQTGIAGCFSLDEYERGLIKKHERTRKEKEDDRTRHVSELSAQTGPVFLAYKSVEKINLEVERIKGRKPLYDFVSEDQVNHTVWAIEDTAQLVEFFATQVQALYIADGHHRAAAADRVRKQSLSQNPQHTGSEDYNFLFAVAFPHDQLQILPYHRAIKDLNGMTTAEYLKKLGADFELTPGDRSLPPKGEFGMYLESKWYRLRQKICTHDLDVAILQDKVLNSILGIQDPRTDRRIDFIGGIRGTEELERTVDSGAAKLAFSLHPTRLEEVMEVSDKEEIMPPKSTWFEPKLRDGLLSYRFNLNQ